MRITYNSPNRSHHYPYAEALYRAGHLHAFVSAFSRYSPRSPLLNIENKLKRFDFFKNLHLASMKINAPYSLISKLDLLAGSYLDKSSYQFAKESDVFIFYRTEGLRTTERLHREKSATLCVMEEVNSHVQVADTLLRSEYEQIGLKKKYEKVADYYLRLKAYEETDLILCPSEFVKNSFLSKGFLPERLIKVNFGFPPVRNFSTSACKKDIDTFRLLYVGQIHYRKGLRYAIEAFRRLKHPKKEFVIVGPKTPVTGLEKTQIPSGVIFTGPLKGEELNNQYINASVFILPSLEEGLALVQGEALAMGIPLLITTNTGGEDLIKDGIEGFIVPPAKAERLAEKLQTLADEKGLMEKMSKAALQTAKSLGSWDNAANHLLVQLTTILNDRNQKPSF